MSRSVHASPRSTRIALILATALLLASPAALAWGPATHAFIADHVGSRGSVTAPAERYGALLPDLFLGRPQLATEFRPWTHGVPDQPEFLDVWRAARLPVDKALAFGYVGHNALWGADRAAHDPEKGYTVGKAVALEEALGADGTWDAFGTVTQLTTTREDRLRISLLVIEAAGDLAIRRLDPAIGPKLAAAATLRTDSTPELLVRVFREARPEDPELPLLVRRVEAEFRRSVLLYGAALAQDDDVARHAVGNHVADMSLRYLAAVNNLEGEAAEALRPAVEALVVAALKASVPLIKDDFALAVRATVVAVTRQLLIHAVAPPRTRVVGR